LSTASAETVAQGDDVLGGDLFQVVRTAAAGADHGDVEAFVGVARAQKRRSAEHGPRRGQRRRLQEAAPIDVVRGRRLGRINMHGSPELEKGDSLLMGNRLHGWLSTRFATDCSFCLRLRNRRATHGIQDRLSYNILLAHAARTKEKVR